MDRWLINIYSCIEFIIFHSVMVFKAGIKIFLHCYKLQFLHDRFISSEGKKNNFWSTTSTLGNRNRIKFQQGQMYKSFLNHSVIAVLNSMLTYTPRRRTVYVIPLVLNAFYIKMAGNQTEKKTIKLK